jgi:hypothetical protein
LKDLLTALAVLFYLPHSFTECIGSGHIFSPFRLLFPFQILFFNSACNVSIKNSNDSQG